MNNFFIGIDSGGTNCTILISELNDGHQNLYLSKALHLNSSTTNDFINYIKNIIYRSLQKGGLNLKDCKGICIGIAGARDLKIREYLTKRLCEDLDFKNIHITTDTEIALTGAFGKDDGIILICGTGSILFGRVKKRIVRIGGWGRILGDEGSGYHIGLQSIRKMILDYEHNTLSEFTRYLEKEFNLNEQNLIEEIYRNKFEIQSIAPAVIDLAEKTNTDALKLIDDSTANLIMLLRLFFSQNKNIKKINLVLNGSLIEKENIFSEKLKRSIFIEFGNKVTITEPICPQVNGAIYLASEKFG